MTPVLQLHPDQSSKTADEQFTTFWVAYPRKVGKPLARAKFLAITNGGLRTRTLDKDSGQYVEIELQATAEEIIAGATRYADAQIDRSGSVYRKKDDGKFILYPETWLNKGRWLDE